MTEPGTIIALAADVAFVLLSVAVLLTLTRVLRGPTLADRVVALDMLSVLAVGLAAVVAVRSGHSLYIDVSVALALAGFLATVALARYIAGSAEGAKDRDREENRP